MNFCILEDSEYLEFVKNMDTFCFYQSIEWGKLKNIYGWDYKLVGVKNEHNEIVGATLLLSKNTIIKKKIFYAPRGFILNYKDNNLLSFFTEEIRKYVKNNQGFFLKIDPNVIYQIRDMNGNIIEGNEKQDLVIANLKKNKFKHFGFNLNFESMQPRWLYRFELAENFETTFNSFGKSVRKNTIDSQNKGVIVRKGTYDDLPLFKEMLDKSGEKNHFITRPLSYYQNMYKCLGDTISLYIAYIDSNEYISNTEKLIIESNNNKTIILKKMNIEKVGKKLTSDLEKCEKQIHKLNKELEFANKLNKEKGQFINIGSLMSLKSNDDYITLNSGMDKNYREFYPKYAMYNRHINDAFEKDVKYVNFYGISGNFNPSNNFYGIYEMKKGYNGNVIELVGEFDLIISPLYYYLYKVAFSSYKFVKNMLKRN